MSWEGKPQVYQTSLLLSIYQVESHTKSLHMYIAVVVGKFASSNKVVCQISSESGFPCLTHQKWKVQGRKVLLLWLFGFLLEIQMTRRRAVVEEMTAWLHSVRHDSCIKDITLKPLIPLNTQAEHPNLYTGISTVYVQVHQSVTSSGPSFVFGDPMFESSSGGCPYRFKFAMYYVSHSRSFKIDHCLFFLRVFLICCFQCSQRLKLEIISFVTVGITVNIMRYLVTQIFVEGCARFHLSNMVTFRSSDV